MRRWLPAAALLALAQSGDVLAAERWTCAKRLPGGDCIGPTTVYEDGETTSGVRGVIPPGDLVWMGKLTRIGRQRVRTECSHAPTGRCDGQLSSFYPDGRRRIETLRIRDGEDEHEGIAITIDPDGRRQECVVNVDGDCEGEAVVLRASREMLHGTRVVRGGESVWAGLGRWTFPNGLVKDCWLAPDATCRPGPVMFWTRDSKTVGTLGADNLLTGAITTYDRKGLKKYCARAVNGECRPREVITTRAAPDAWQPPRPRKASAARPPEIRAAFTPSVLVTIPGPDSALIRYQFLACGDEVRLAYTVVQASRPRVPVNGQVWRMGVLVGAFTDPAAGQLPMAALTCRGPQTRLVTTLRARQKDLAQHTFVDGSDAWTTEEVIRHFLDELSVRALPPAAAAEAPRPVPIAVPVPVPPRPPQPRPQ